MSHPASHRPPAASTPSHSTRIGYSFWGFLGPGITDTPDGGRFWRRPIIDALTAAGYQMILLQRNRDKDEAEQDLPYQWHLGFPGLDVLFAEWRWPLPGRNTTLCTAPGHTCDLHRQNDLLDHYTRAGLPTVLWDTDRQLPAGDPLRRLPNVCVCEPAIVGTPGARTLLQPLPDTALDNANAERLAAIHRDLSLVYVGNQYDRDDQFTRYFAPAAARYQHRVAGKWPRTQHWPHVNFTGRCAFTDVQRIYQSGLATILLLPERYARAGQQTQRLFEAVLAGCLPLTPTPIPPAATWTPPHLHVADSTQVISQIHWAHRISGSTRHAQLIADCLSRLEPFRLTTWTRTLTNLLDGLHRADATR